MTRLLALTFSVLLTCGCSTPPGQNSAAISSRDTVVIIHRDTIIVVQKAEEKVVDKPIEKEKPLPKLSTAKKDTPVTKSPVVVKQTAEADTTYHYYINKRVSVKITPWIDGERWVLLYNLLGEETYRSKDVRKSYTEIAQLKFHPNGAVSSMNIHLNPGASMYWYETTITFSTTNDPLQKSSERKPYEDLSAKQKPWEYWDNKTKQWKKQEVME